MPDYFSHPALQAMLAQQPGMIFYKNMEHVYCATSDYTARLCGYQNALTFSGRNDYELRCSALESADAFRAEDRRVIESGEMLTCLQMHQYADNRIHIFMLKKTPVKDADGKTIGICGFGSEITNPGVEQVFFNLLSLGNSDYHAAMDSMHNLKINDLYEQLSLRESDVLFYFMRGFTHKDIGAYLKLSPRTVETYLERIKMKFKTCSRNELQDYCMQQGLIYIIPKSILGRCLNTSIAWR